MRRKTKFLATPLVVAPILAIGLSAAPVSPAQALGQDSLRSVIGQALMAPAAMLGQASKMAGQPQMMVQSDMMRGMEDMPGPGRMMGGMMGMMGMMQMMGRMDEMMGDEGMMEQMGEMMETCNRMMQAMMDDEEDQRPEGQPRWDEQPEIPQQ